MGFQPMIWATRNAPITDVEEWAVLVALAESADEDGCSSYPSTRTIAHRTKLSERTVQRRLDALEARGVIVRGDQSQINPKIPLDRRPVLYDLMIPAEHWGVGPLAELNATTRADKGRPPITPENRPPLPPAPGKKRRSDHGVSRPVAQDVTVADDSSDDEGADGHGVTTSHPLTTSHPVTLGRDRGDYKSPGGVTTSHPTQPSNPTHDSPPLGVAADAGPDTPDHGPSEEFFTEATPKSRSKQTPPRRATRAPETFEVTETLRAWAEQNTPQVDLARETEQFLDHHRAKGTTFKDWSAGWRTWMRNAQKFADRDGPRDRNGRRVGSNLIVDSSIDPDSDIFGFNQ